VVHDGHDGTLLAADRYASRLVPRVLRALGSAESVAAKGG